jgi:hypothetical protein
VQLAARAGATVVAPALPEDEAYLRELGVSELLPRDGDLAAARDLERATCAGALGHEALEFGYGDVSSRLIRRSACCIPVSRAVGFGWAGRCSS